MKRTDLTPSRFGSFTNKAISINSKKKKKPFNGNLYVSSMKTDKNCQSDIKGGLKIVHSTEVFFRIFDNT